MKSLGSSEDRLLIVEYCELKKKTKTKRNKQKSQTKHEREGDHHTMLIVIGFT